MTFKTLWECLRRLQQVGERRKEGDEVDENGNRNAELLEKKKDMNEKETEY